MKQVNVHELARYVEENEPKMVEDQSLAYQTILHDVTHSEGGIFFLDAPGGTGKTFLTNLLLAKVRHNKCIALAVASSGIAATLLTGGRDRSFYVQIASRLGQICSSNMQHLQRH